MSGTATQSPTLEQRLRASEEKLARIDAHLASSRESSADMDRLRSDADLVRGRLRDARSASVDADLENHQPAHGLLASVGLELDKMLATLFGSDDKQDPQQR